MHDAVVFVQLGKNPATSLSSMAQSAKIINRNIQLFLITDFPSIWKDFPGKVIGYESIHRDKFISKFEKKYPELYSVAGGYWLYTLERLYALERIYDDIPPNASFLHVESDVLILLNENDMELLNQKLKQIACPRFSAERGIASVLYVPNENVLERTIKSFTQILNGTKAPKNDMDLLGVCLNKGIIDELPTLPEHAWENSQGEKLVFDGAAYGQYLFGQDPFHTEGKRISGFQNPDFGLTLRETRWEILESNTNQSPSLTYSHHGVRYRVLNLHIHSKLGLNPPSLDETRWFIALREANGEISRIADPYQPNQIHTTKISMLNRYRIARRKGLVSAVSDGITRRIRSARNRFRR